MCAHSWKSSKINVMKYMSLFTHIIITGNQRQFADLPIVHLIYNAVCYHDSQFRGLKAQNETKAETKRSRRDTQPCLEIRTSTH